MWVISFNTGHHLVNDQCWSVSHGLIWIRSIGTLWFYTSWLFCGETSDQWYIHFSRLYSTGLAIRYHNEILFWEWLGILQWAHCSHPQFTASFPSVYISSFLVFSHSFKPPFLTGYIGVRGQCTTATVDPVGRIINSLRLSLFFIDLFCCI